MKQSSIAFFLAASTAASFFPPAQAQTGGEVITTGGVLPAALNNSLDPAERLASSLRLLSQNPYDVTALSQAGESALAVGDANAAISFLARAEELNPGNGRIKASLASALVMVERPTEAFRLFQEALALGVPEHQIAKDRGLAYDLTGDTKRAQKDYTVSLRHDSDEEVTRRMALSLGIAGDKDDALRTLEPLIRQKDQAAWRARAFVLAMNGDMRGAEKIAEQTTPAAMVGSMSQFMRRLGTLTPAQRAYAVNFGTMPATDARMASAQTTDPFRPIGDGAASVLTPFSEQPRPAPAALTTLPERVIKAARRRPGRDEIAPVAPRPVSKPVELVVAQPVKPSWSTEPVSRRLGARIGPVDPNRLPDELKPAQGIDRNVAARSPVFVRTDLKVMPPPSGTPAIVTTFPPPVAPQTVAATPAFVMIAPVISPAVPTAMPAPALFEVPSAAQQVVRVVDAPPAAASISPGISAAQPQLASSSVLPSPVATAPVLATPILVGSPPAAVLAPATSNVPVSSQPVTQIAAALPPAPGFSDGVMPAAVVVEPALAPVVTNAVSQTGAEASFPQSAPPQAIVQAVPAAPEGLVSVLSSIELEAESSGGAVMSDSEFRKARLAAKRKADAQDAKLVEADAATKLKAKEEDEKRRISDANPARLWVQVATGANEAGLSRTLSRVREQAPVALKGVGGASVPFKSTNRVLVGPFKSASEARAMMNKLTKAGISAATFSSTAGQKVSKLPSR